MSRSMSDERHSEVLGGLPRTRPHRRSDKRAATSAAPATPGPETTPAAEPTPEPEAEITPETQPEATRRRRPKPPPAKPKPTKPAAKRPAAKKPAARKAAARKPAARKPAARKAAAKKATANTPAADTPAATGGTRLRQPAQPDGLPAQPRGTNRPAPRPSALGAAAPPKGGEILGTAVQAAAEIAEIGLSAGARAIRRAVSRLPRP